MHTNHLKMPLREYTMKWWTHFLSDTEFVLDEPLLDKRVIVEIRFHENV